MASRKRRSHPLRTVLAVLLVLAAALALLFYGLTSRRIRALRQGADFSFQYTVTSTRSEPPALYSILEKTGTLQGHVEGCYAPGKLLLSLFAQQETAQPFTRVYVSSDETLFDAARLYDTLRIAVADHSPLAGALLPDWTLGDYISQTQLAQLLGAERSEVELQEMADLSLSFRPQDRVTPAAAKKGYVYYRLSSASSGSASVILGFPLRAFFADVIPVELFVEIPAHGITAELSGSLCPAETTIVPPVSRMQEDDIAAFVQLRTVLSQLWKLVQTTLNAVS